MRGTTTKHYFQQPPNHRHSETKYRRHCAPKPATILHSIPSSIQSVAPNDRKTYHIRLTESVLERCVTGSFLSSSSLYVIYGMYLRLRQEDDAGTPKAGSLREAPHVVKLEPGAIRRKTNFMYENVMTAIGPSHFLRHSRSAAQRIRTHM